MKTRNIIIVLAIFYAIIIPVTLFFLFPVEEEKKHGLEIIMEKTVYKKGEVVEYDGNKLIVQNNTGWDREIFSNYKLFELKDHHGNPLFIIPYKLDVNIINAKFHVDENTPTTIYFTFDTTTKDKTLDILLPKILEPQSTDLIIQSFILDELIMGGARGIIPPQFHFPLIKIKDYDTHTHYLVPLHNDTTNNLALDMTSIVMLPKGKLFSYNLEPTVGFSYWAPFSHTDFDFFSLDTKH